MMRPEDKLAIRVMIRRALRELNARSYFTCFDCVCCVPRDMEDEERGFMCSAEVVAFPSDKNMPAHLLPDCFSYNFMNSPLADVLESMHHMNIDFHEADHGWPTVVARLLPRLNRFGHNMLIKRQNLEKWQ